MENSHNSRPTSFMLDKLRVSGVETITVLKRRILRKDTPALDRDGYVVAVHALLRMLEEVYSEMGVPFPNELEEVLDK